jgi:hypothetical protein
VLPLLAIERVAYLRLDMRVCVLNQRLSVVGSLIRSVVNEARRARFLVPAGVRHLRSVINIYS